MLPVSKFAEILINYKDQAIKDWDEIIMAAEVMADRPNFMTMDERGFYHAQASGALDEVVRALEHHLLRLKKIQQQKQEGQK